MPQPPAAAPAYVPGSVSAAGASVGGFMSMAGMAERNRVLTDQIRRSKFGDGAPALFGGSFAVLDGESRRAAAGAALLGGAFDVLRDRAGSAAENMARMAAFGGAAGFSASTGLQVPDAPSAGAMDAAMRAKQKYPDLREKLAEIKQDWDDALGRKMITGDQHKLGLSDAVNDLLGQHATEFHLPQGAEHGSQEAARLATSPFLNGPTTVEGLLRQNDDKLAQLVAFFATLPQQIADALAARKPPEAPVVRLAPR